MRFDEWEPTYREILAEFGYSRDADERARDLLADLLAARRRATRADVERALHGARAVVVGPARAPGKLPEGVLVATDAALAGLVARGIVPAIVVTDLDGHVGSHVAASRAGALLVVHAHGDNERALRDVVPRLEGPVLGTTQAAPARGVECFGGFTDGDRAVLMAAECGAREIVLVGFDFDAPVPKPGRDADVKRRKLAWARALVQRAAARVPVRAVREAETGGRAG